MRLSFILKLLALGIIITCLLVAEAFVDINRAVYAVWVILLVYFTLKEAKEDDDDKNGDDERHQSSGILFI